MAAFNIDATDVDVLNTSGEQAKGKTFLITGPSKTGIGAQVAISLASVSPKLIILAGREESKILPVINEITQANSDVQVKYVHLDLMSHESVRKAVATVKAITNNINYLINNAGVMATRKFTKSKDGIQSQFAVSYLSHFLFTNLLLKESIVSSGDVILNVGSLGYQMADIMFEDINFKVPGKTGWRDVQWMEGVRSGKSAQLLGTRGHANRLKGKNISVIVAHPGVTMESQLLANSAINQEYFGDAYALAIERNNGQPLPPQNMVSLKQTAGVVAALNPVLREKPAPFVVDNAVYNGTREYANNDADADKLWALSEKLVQEKFIF